MTTNHVVISNQPVYAIYSYDCPYFVAGFIQTHFFTVMQQPSVGQGLLSVDDTQSNADTPQSVGLPWTNNQLVAETSIWQHTALTRDRYPCPRRDSNQHASGRRPKS